MQRYSNTIINLDKTIELSRHIMNGNIEPSSIFEINTFQYKYLNYSIGKMIPNNQNNQIQSEETIPPKQLQFIDEKTKQKRENQTG